MNLGFFRRFFRGQAQQRICRIVGELPQIAALFQTGFQVVLDTGKQIHQRALLHAVQLHMLMIQLMEHGLGLFHDVCHHIQLGKLEHTHQLVHTVGNFAQARTVDRPPQVALDTGFDGREFGKGFLDDGLDAFFGFLIMDGSSLLSGVHAACTRCGKSRFHFNDDCGNLHELIIIQQLIDGQ